MLVLLMSLAFAQEIPEFDETVKEVEEVKKPVGEASAEVGGSLVSGNSDFYQLTAKLAGGYKWDANRISALADALWGKGYVDLDGSGTLEDIERRGDRVETARRFAADVRYDRFFGERNSLYILAGALVDPFAGYDLRTHEQIGYSRHLVDAEKTSVIVEIGADYAQENYVDGVDPNYVDVIAAREMIALKHTFTDSFAIENVAEAFENLVVFEDVRVNNTFTLSAKLSDKLSLKASHALRFDNLPVEGFRPTDQTALVTLVASLYKTEPPPPPPEPDPCDCGEDEVVPAEAPDQEVEAPREAPEAPEAPEEAPEGTEAPEETEGKVTAPREAPAPE